MNILLHVCCAPCAIFPLEELRREGHRVTGLFYNPNIHPYTEYARREEALRSYAKAEALNVTYGEYEIEKFFEGIVYDSSPRERCPLCWWMRMEKTVRFARENNLDAFTTTLLGSPYQDHAVIKNICEDISKRTGAKFYYKDFRPGFKKAHEKALASGIYCQKYCGCLFSERDRFLKAKKGDK
jgi:predicted adenine nucleotide alpha hydrolase (AANH) superfamily ATPase